MALYPATPSSAPQEPDVGVSTCRARYEKLCTERDPFLRRARECAALTIPALMPPEGASGATELPEPFQSAGAEGVNSLAAKILLALLPPGSAFFRLVLEDSQRAAIEQASNGADVIGEIDATLGKIEKTVLNRVELRGWRVSKFDALKHLLAVGNVLMHLQPDDSMRLHYLNRYVVKRDPVGNVLEIITKETIAKVALAPKARALVDEYDDETKDKDGVDVYTRVYREDTKFHVYQEICGQRVPDSDGTYPLDKSPWMALRYVKVDGQDYGRGRVEEWLGDFKSLESLTQSLVEGSAIMAKIVFLIDEAGLTSAKALQDAANGEFVEGRKKDVEVLQVDKLADFQVPAAKAKELEIRLKQAFLVQQQRDAERVTAEEVRAVIAELEKTLGGLYSILAQEWQGPAVRRLLFQMSKRQEIPALPDSIVEPKIITGLDALGRTADFQKLRTFVAEIGAEFGPQAVTEYVNVGAYLKRLAAALQIDDTGLIRSEEEVQAAQQQRAQQELLTKMGPNAIKAESDQALATQKAQAPQPTAA